MNTTRNHICSQTWQCRDFQYMVERISIAFIIIHGRIAPYKCIYSKGAEQVKLIKRRLKGILWWNKTCSRWNRMNSIPVHGLTSVICNARANSTPLKTIIKVCLDSVQFLVVSQIAAHERIFVSANFYDLTYTSIDYFEKWTSAALFSSRLTFVPLFPWIIVK